MGAVTGAGASSALKPSLQADSRRLNFNVQQHNMTLPELYNSVRERFPLISQKADGLHIQLWGPPEAGSPYVWFESLANAINLEIAAEVDPADYKALLNFLDKALASGSAELRDCLDVSFMENLFWRVACVKARPYWEVTPKRLREFHVALHGKGPVA